MRRLLFLDIDGVLNHSDWRRPPKRRGDDSIAESLRRKVDPACVDRLNLILMATQCDVVLSSTWRHYAPTHEICAGLRRLGMRGSLIGRTPLSSERDLDVFRRYRGRPPQFLEPYPRGYEIQQWIDCHDFELYPSIVILDDDADMEHLCPRLVRTSFEQGGLQLGHVRRAIELLNRS